MSDPAPLRETTRETTAPPGEPAPEYFPDTFPQHAFPRVALEPDGAPAPGRLPGDVWLTETTHRDGQQGGLPLTAAQGVRVYEILCRATGRSGAIRQAEFFVYRDGDRAMLEGALERWRSGAPIEPTTWIRARRDDVALVADLGVRETGMLASISDFHTFHKFTPGGRERAVRGYLEAVAMALDAGLRPRLHLEDATRAPLDAMLALVEGAHALAEPYGAEQRPKFRICDTLGLGLPFEDAALPRGVPRLVRAFREAGCAPEQLEFHPHNDTHLVVANALAALRAGCAAVNGTCLGKGERSGNLPLEGVLLHLMGMGRFEDPAPDLTALNDLADLYGELGQAPAPKYPLFGRDAHRTRAGIHADGINKFWWMYAPFNVPELLGRPLEVTITKDSGVAGLQFLLRQHGGLELPKSDERLQRLHERVQAEFDAGRVSGVEWEELERMLDGLG